MHIWVTLKEDNDSDYSYWQSAYESIDDRAESIPMKLKKALLPESLQYKLQ